MGDDFSFEDLLIIARRRLWHFIAPAALVLAIGLAVVMLLPSKYAATGTILVVGAEIPADLVRSTVTAYAQERIQTIRARVMTRSKLLEVADKYGVYPNKDGFSDSRRVDLLRKGLKVDVIRADGFQQGGGRDGTIAFSVTFEHAKPNVAFQVVNEIMSLFLTEDARTRTANAQNNTEFFKGETQRLGAQVNTLETAIANFKSKNVAALPDSFDARKSALERAIGDLKSLDVSIGGTEDELRYIESQLSGAAAASTSGIGGELTAKRAELARLRAVYTDSHPSVAGLRAEIAQLQGAAGGVASAALRSLQQQMAAASTQLQTLTAATPVDAEAVKAKKKQLQDLRARMGEIVARANSGGDPIILQLQGRYSMGLSRINLLTAEREELAARVAQMETDIARTPEVEAELSVLMRDYQTVSAEYKNILAKQQDAQLSQNLETNQKGEKFSIIDAAVAPDRPTSPDRPKLAVLVLFLSLAAGAGVAFLAEMLGGAVRGQTHLEKLIDAHPIAVIPFIRSDDDSPPMRLPVFGGRQKRAAAAAAAAAASVVAAAGGVAPAPDAGDFTPVSRA